MTLETVEWTVIDTPDEMRNAVCSLRCRKKISSSGLMQYCLNVIQKRGLCEHISHIHHSPSVDYSSYYFRKGMRLPSSIGTTRDSSVGIATGYRLDGQGIGVRFPTGARDFSALQRPNRLGGPIASYKMDTGAKVVGT
jgi:hypothetical protein